MYHAGRYSVQYFFVFVAKFTTRGKFKLLKTGKPLWLSGKVVKNEKINEIERSQVCSPPPGQPLF
jgi:hypothetical protein